MSARGSPLPVCVFVDRDAGRPVLLEREGAEPQVLDEEPHDPMGECAQLMGAVGGASDADDAGVTHHVGQRRQIDERCAGVDRGEWVGVRDDPPGHLVDVPGVAAKIIASSRARKSKRSR